MPKDKDDKDIPVLDEKQEAEMARMKAEIAELKARPAAPPPPQPQIHQLSDEELQKQAEELGFTDPKQVQSVGKIAAHVAAPAYKMVNELKLELGVEKAVGRAKREALAADPQFSKLETHVDEYLADIPPSDKMDPTKLKAHMERATFFAKGKVGVANDRRQPPPARVKDDGGDDFMDEGDKTKDDPLSKGPERWETRDGKTRLTIEPLVSNEVRKMHKHPDIDGAVRIDSKEEWKGPIFEKDVKRG